MQIEFLIDDLKAEKIGNRLFTDFYGHKGFFKETYLPEYILPSKIVKGSKEHALFLTYVMSINYMTDSAQLWKKAKAAYSLFPERFMPEKILKSSPQTVETFVKYLGSRQQVNAAKTWIRISKILVDNYGGDPRNITKEPSKIQEIQRRLRLFPGLRGEKLSNYYIRLMGETGLLKVKNLNQLSIPIDRQLARFTVYSGILKLLNRSFSGDIYEEPFRELIEEVWKNAAKPLGTASWKLHDPIWIVESTLCEDKKCKLCPVDDQCEKKRQGIVFKENTVFWRRTR